MVGAPNGGLITAGAAGAEQQEELDDGGDGEPLTDFWVYVQPAELYNLLAYREKHEPKFLRRNLSYAKRPPPPQCVTKPSNRNDKLSIEVANLTGGHLTHSTFVFLCRKIAKAEYLPFGVTVLHIPPEVHDPLLPHPYPKASFYPPAHSAQDLYGPEAELVLLFVVWVDHPELGGLKRSQGQPLHLGLEGGLMCGWLPQGADVRWAELKVWEPLRSYNHTFQVELAAGRLHSGKLQALRDVGKQAGVLQVEQLSAPPEADAGPSTGGCALEAAAAMAVSARSAVKLQVILRHEVGRLQANGKRRLEGDDAAQALLGKAGAGQGKVYWRYFYGGDAAHFVESTVGHACPLCGINACSLTGLREHMEACHDLLQYGWPLDHPDRPPTVNVRVIDGLYDADGSFRSREAEAYRLRPDNKDFKFRCSRRERRAAVAANGSMWRRPKRWPSTCSTDSLGSSQDPRGGAAARKRLGAPRSRLLAAGLGGKFYHSHSAAPMTLKEVVGDFDSDDEEDFEEWKKRCSRKLDSYRDLTAEERQFMVMWNCYTHVNPVFSDEHTATACEAFARHNVEQLRRFPELRRCFSVHLLNLWEYALLDTAQLDRCLAIVRAT